MPGDTVLADSLQRGWYRVALEGEVLGYVHRTTLHACRADGAVDRFLPADPRRRSTCPPPESGIFKPSPNRNPTCPSSSAASKRRWRTATGSSARSAPAAWRRSTWPQDLRHDRKVALKVLQPELAAVIGAERFLAEIKLTANLQHPHILPLFDSGEADGFLFYVMPFVEGESLRDRLSREKQLPVDEAVRIATEVAEALDYAHRHGVIHRDIKPENILLHDGRALVADFGIALAASKASGARMTETGMSLGTPHYMSPEQAMGEREITARSDVYALGAVLYEMLTGDPPFTGSTAQAIVARVLTEAPRPCSPSGTPSRRTWRRRCSPRWRSCRPTGSPPRRSSPRRWRGGTTCPPSPRQPPRRLPRRPGQRGAAIPSPSRSPASRRSPWPPRSGAGSGRHPSRRSTGSASSCRRSRRSSR